MTIDVLPLCLLHTPNSEVAAHPQQRSWLTLISYHFSQLCAAPDGAAPTTRVVLGIVTRRRENLLFSSHIPTSTSPLPLG